MTLKEAINIEFKKLSDHENVVFLGENITNSGRIYSTMDNIPINKCIEMPVAENLIAGCGVGLALSGFNPIVLFQRMDFILIASDQIINHACLIPKMTGVHCPVMFITFKATLKDSFYAGLQHTKDFTHVFSPYMSVCKIPDDISNFSQLDDLLLLPEKGPRLVVIDHESLNNPV